MIGSWREGIFFGLHFDLHAREDDIGFGSELSVDELVRELGKVKPDWLQCDCKGHAGYASYPTRIGVYPAGLGKDCLGIYREAARRLGIPLVVHFSGVWDSAAIARHSEWARVLSPKERAAWPSEVDGAGHEKNITCPLSEYTRAYMIPQMLEIIDTYDVDGFWVDGENWAALPCWCPRCRAAFLHKAAQACVPEEPAAEAWNEWLAFHRDLFQEHVKQYVEAVHERKPSCTVISNWMYTLRQPERVQVSVDYLSGDFGWVWSAAMAEQEGRYLDSHGMDWELMGWGFTSYGPLGDWTFKTVPALCQEAGAVMASGGKLLWYDQPDRKGPLVSWHMDEFGKVARFCRERQPYCQGTRSVPHVAILHAQDHYYRNNLPLFNHGDALRPVEGALQALLESSLSVDVLGSHDLQARLKSYPLLVVPEQSGLASEAATLLESYVEDGGHLIISGAGVVGQLSRFLGIRDTGRDSGGLWELPVMQPVFLPHGRGTVCAPGIWRLVELDGAREIAPILFGRDSGERSRPSGYPAATIRRAGKGAVVAVCGNLFDSFARSHYPGLRDFVATLVRELAPPSPVCVTAPPRIHVSLRERAGTLFVHLLNTGCDHPLSARNAIVENVPPAGPVSVSLRTTRAPKKVYLAPSMAAPQWTHDDGMIRIEVPSVGIHDILVLEGLSAAGR